MWKLKSEISFIRFLWGILPKNLIFSCEAYFNLSFSKYISSSGERGPPITDNLWLDPFLLLRNPDIDSSIFFDLEILEMITKSFPSKLLQHQKIHFRTKNI